ncbi:MAG: single-stranded DNA-binding protein [Chitinophagales bacterium]|nr:single-stranded DNA-binding protein [Chitinophagales bacterium]
MVNKVILVGNLGKDPEVRTLESGNKSCNFSLATNESYKDKNNTWQTLTEWHNVVAWNYLAEKAERDLRKGSSVYVEGKIVYRKYTDKEGNERYITEIVANNLYSLDKKDKLTTSEGSFSTPSLDNKSHKTDPEENDLPF